jgi:hypothetical protein
VAPRKINRVFGCRKNDQAILNQAAKGLNEAYSTSTVEKFPEINAAGKGIEHENACTG